MKIMETLTPEEESLAREIYIALIGNPERYKYIVSLFKSEKMTHEEANEKNRNKAVKLAKYFYANPDLTRP